jgi:hypothetical protein
MDRIIPGIRRPSRVAFHRWLERSHPGEQFEYYRGLLVRDRSPASELADAVFRAAVDGSVHLVQRRHAPFDFS